MVTQDQVQFKFNMSELECSIMSVDQMSTDDANSADGEGVWSPDIEQSFQEALLMFPPCGRRKHILQEEGGSKMYGRNELISRHIFLQTGKHRTRKQVSSHIQVLARRKAKVDVSLSGGSTGSATPSPSSFNGTYNSENSNRLTHQDTNSNIIVKLKDNDHITQNFHLNRYNQDVWLDRPIVTPVIRLVDFSAYIDRPEEVSPMAVAQNYRPFNQAEGERSHYLGLGASLPLSSQAPQTTRFANYNSPVQCNRLGGVMGQATASSSSFGALLPIGSLPQTDTTVNSLFTSILGANERQIDYAGNRIRTLPESGNKIRRQSYVHIDYSRIGQDLNSNPINKLERIDIAQIQDKFPDINGQDGLSQKCPPGGFFLIKFWANIDPDANLDSYSMEDQNSKSEFASRFETIDPLELTCSTKACSYGSKVVEKVHRMSPVFNSCNGRYSYSIRSQMCEFMTNFIKKLRQLPRLTQMNSVLENFSVLQVVSCESSSEVLLCLAYVFEVTSLSHQIEGGAHHRVYVLTRD